MKVLKLNDSEVEVGLRTLPGWAIHDGKLHRAGLRAGGGDGEGGETVVATSWRRARHGLRRKRYRCPVKYSSTRTTRTTPAGDQPA